jgi:DNA-directed RNA polymerase specialized sigma24 family protein
MLRTRCKTPGRAWPGLAGCEGRASVRTWLYRVAASRCLDALRSARRRPPASMPPPGLEPPEPTRLGEVLWLEPYPDAPLEGLAGSAPGPEARYEALESISLAFITALQLPPPVSALPSSCAMCWDSLPPRPPGYWTPARSR